MSLRKNKPRSSFTFPSRNTAPATRPDFATSRCRRPGEMRRPDINVVAKDTQRYRLQADPRPGRRRHCPRPVGPAQLDVETLKRGLKPHADGAHLRRPHVRGPAPGQDLVLHEVHRRRGDGGRAGRRARPRRHVLPHLSPAGPADRARLSARRHDVPGLFERARPAQRPPAADHVFVEEARLLLDRGQPRPRSSARPSAGRWPRPTEATTASPQPGSATARPPKATSTPRSPSPPSIARR